jgi:hypothetical protein
MRCRWNGKGLSFRCFVFFGVLGTKTLPVSQNVTSHITVVLFRASVSRYTLLTASERASSDFGAKQFSLSARKYIIFVTTQILHEYRPSNKNDLDSVSLGAWESLFYGTDCICLPFCTVQSGSWRVAF